MSNINKEQYVQLRQKGYSPEDIQDFARRNRVDDVLNKKTFREQGLLRSAADFLNMDEFGRGIGQTIYNATGERRQNQDAILQQTEEQDQRLIQAIREGREAGRDTSKLESLLGEENNVDFQQLADGGITNREVLGSAASTGLNIASLGGALNIGGAAAKGTTSVGAAALKGAGQGALAGGLFGAAEATTEGEGALPGAAKGAAMGAAVGGVLGGASKYIDDLTKVTPDSRLHDTKDAFKTLKRKFEKGTVRQTVNGKKQIISDPITTITDEGIGTQLRVVDGKVKTEQARALVRELIDEQKEEVTSAVAQATAQSKNTSLMSLKQSAIEQVRSNESLKSRGAVKKTIREIDTIFDDFLDSYGDDLTTENVNAIREGMNKVFNADTIDAERAIGDAARKYVYQNAPGSQKALSREGQLIAADTFLDALENRTVKGGRMGGYIANLVGAIAGQNTTDSYIGSVVGAAAGGKLAKVTQSQQLNPIVPRVTRAITNQIDRLPTDTAGNISKTAVLNLIAQISAQPASEQTDLLEAEESPQ